MATLEEVAAELFRRQGASMAVGCAVDGSQISDRAMDCALLLADAKRGDKFVVLHVSDSSKAAWLPKHLTPSHLKSVYADRAMTNRVSAEWMCREKEEGRSTCESLTRMADKCKIDMLVIGSFGRKGEKLDVLGSVSDFSLRQSRSSICIVRGTGGSVGHNSTKYLFATDGSRAAHLAFCWLATYIMRPSDSVYVAMVTTKDGADEVKVVDKYREYMKHHNITGNCGVKCIDRLTTKIPEGIVNVVAERGCDVLVMGISGYGKKKLGSVSEEISVRAPCTTIIIKDHKETAAYAA